MGRTKSVARRTFLWQNLPFLTHVTGGRTMSLPTQLVPCWHLVEPYLDAKVVERLDQLEGQLCPHATGDRPPRLHVHPVEDAGRFLYDVWTCPHVADPDRGESFPPALMRVPLPDLARLAVNHSDGDVEVGVSPVRRLADLGGGRHQQQLRVDPECGQREKDHVDCILVQRRSVARYCQRANADFLHKKCSKIHKYFHAKFPLLLLWHRKNYQLATVKKECKGFYAPRVGDDACEVGDQLGGAGHERDNDAPAFVVDVVAAAASRGGGRKEPLDHIRG